MKSLTSRRILAFGLDYLIIALYASALFGITSLIEPEELAPLSGQLVGFTTLTLPVFLYFFFFEKGKSRATIGKRAMKISVHCGEERNGRRILLRNLLKFLPWEIAHIGVHWSVYYASVQVDTPLWVWIALILPQVIVCAYIVSIFLYKGKSSLYDQWAQTGVKLISP